MKNKFVFVVCLTWFSQICDAKPLLVGAEFGNYLKAPAQSSLAFVIDKELYSEKLVFLVGTGVLTNYKKQMGAQLRATFETGKDFGMSIGNRVNITKNDIWNQTNWGLFTYIDPQNSFKISLGVDVFEKANFKIGFLWNIET